MLDQPTYCSKVLRANSQATKDQFKTNDALLTLSDLHYRHDMMTKNSSAKHCSRIQGAVTTVYVDVQDLKRAITVVPHTGHICYERPPST